MAIRIVLVSKRGNLSSWQSSWTILAPTANFAPTALPLIYPYWHQHSLCYIGEQGHQDQPRQYCGTMISTHNVNHGEWMFDILREVRWGSHRKFRCIEKPLLKKLPKTNNCEISVRWRLIAWTVECAHYPCCFALLPFLKISPSSTVFPYNDHQRYHHRLSLNKQRPPGILEASTDR